MEYPNFGDYISGIATAPINLLCDLILVTIVIVFAVQGAKKGFVNSTYSFVKPVGTLIIAFLLCRPLGNWLFDMHLFDGLTESVKNSLVDMIQSNEFLAEHEGQTVTGFTGIIGALLALSGDQELTEKLSNILTADPETMYEIASSITSVLAVIFTFIALLIFGGLLIKLAFKLLDQVFSLPVLNVVNFICGIVMGLLIGGVIAWLSSYLIYFLVTWLGGTMNIPFFAAFGTGKGTYIEQFLFGFNPVRFALESLADSMIFA